MDDQNKSKWRANMSPDLVNRIRYLAVEYGVSEEEAFDSYLNEWNTAIILDALTTIVGSDKDRLASLSELSSGIFVADGVHIQTEYHETNDLNTKTDFIYRKLRKEEQDIRLLRIHPGSDFGSTVHYSIFTTPLQQAPAFTALSYVWGDPNVKEDVLVNGTALLVTKSLASALRQVRASGATEIMNAFWADGLSINQSDNAEKGHQVRLMSEILQKSNTHPILAWCGSRRW